MRRRRSAHERGAALVIVLWMLLLMSLLAASFIVTRRSDLEIARNVVESARAQALADAGVARAAVGLGEIDTHLRWRADGSANRWAFGGGTVVVSITGENGKIDINAAPAEVLLSLFQYVGADSSLSAQLAQEILDRRAAGSAASPGSDSEATGFDPNKRGFVTTEELGSLAGMTAAVLHAVLPLVTVYSGAATVDPTVAPRAVLLSLPGANEAEIDTFLAARADGGESNSAPIASPASIASYLAFAPLSAVTIRASATTDTGAVFVREALVLVRETEGQPFVVEGWAQGVAVQ